MKKEKFEEFVENLELEKEKWITLDEVDSIILSNGVGIYPDWKHLRFRIKDSEILIQHGDSSPYGARLGTRYQMDFSRTGITYPSNNIVPDTQYYYNFRNPVAGDVIRASEHGEAKDEVVIIETIPTIAGLYIELARPVAFSNEMLFSFYDPMQFEKDNCMHSDIVDGIFMKFNPNLGKLRKDGVYHDSIKVKDISEIRLKIKSKRQNRIYKIKE